MSARKTTWKGDVYFDDRLIFKFYETWDRKKPHVRWFRFKVRHVGSDDYIFHSRSGSRLDLIKEVARKWIIAKIKAEPGFLGASRLHRFEARWH